MNKFEVVSRFKDSEINLIENMHELAKNKEAVKSVHEVKPVYLKD